ncbi:MAG: Nramp family divalent metal transporter [Candidatus Saccharibacteria bacterium]|jgi:NRAMP (natural resistance-associated macrophage protein)-like metal ion transporter
MEQIEHRWKKTKRFLKRLGPGIVTGAADDDPSGIATYSQAGAAFGFHMIWMTLYMLPMMVSVQEISGRIGLVTGKGLAAVIKKNYNRWILYFAVFFLVFANVINIGADIGAMASSAQLLFPSVPFVWLTIFFSVGVALLEIIIPYRRYSKILKWLAISLFAYVITAFVVTQPWMDIFKHLLIPTIEFTPAFIVTMVAVLGTTISPYLFFWEPSQEVEEEIRHGWLRITKNKKPDMTERRVTGFRKDNLTGMLFSEMTAFFIMVTAASTLHVQGITDIPNAAAAAKAIEPLVQTFPYAGQIAKTIFALGIIGTGLLAIPVLAGSTAYAVSEAVGIKEGLFRKAARAKGFYIIIAGATIGGLLINFIQIDPIKALFWSAVVNGVLAVPLIAIIIKIGSNRKIMGKYTTRPLVNLFARITFVVMACAALAMIFVH